MKKRVVLAVFSGALIVSVIIRAYSVINLLERDTGFIKRGSQTAYGVLFCIIAALAVFVCLLALSGNPAAGREKKFTLFGAVTAFLLACAVVMEVFTAGFNGVPAGLTVAFKVFAYATAAYFLCMAARPFIHFKLSPKLAILPICFFTLKAATVFITTSYHAVIGATVFGVIIYCLCMLFSLELARAVNAAGGKRSVHKITGFGLCCAFFALTYSVAEFAVALFAKAALHERLTAAVLPLFLGLYIAVLVFSRVDFSSGGDLKLGIYYAGKH